MDNKLINDVQDMLELYKSKETDQKTNLIITIPQDNSNERVISISYGNNYFNKTEFSVIEDGQFDSSKIFNLVSIFKQQELIKDEKLSSLDNNQYNYQCVLASNRTIILENISFELINKVKLMLTGKTYKINDPTKKDEKKSSDGMGNNGFSNYLLLSITSLLILDLLFIGYLISRQFP